MRSTKGLFYAAIVLVCTLLGLLTIQERFVWASSIQAAYNRVQGVTATGAPVTEDPVMIGGEGSSITKFPLVFCDQQASFTAPAATTTLILAGVASRSFWICGLTVSGDAVGTFGINAGTGGTCSGGMTQVVMVPMTLAVGVPIAWGSGMAPLFHTNTTANSLCVVTTGVGAIYHGTIAFATL